MSIESLFPIKIYRTNYGNVEKIQELCDVDFWSYLSAHSHQKDCGNRFFDRELGEKNLSSTFESRKNIFPHKTKKFKELSKFIQLHAEKYWAQLNYFSNMVPKISQSWITSTQNDANILPHRHDRFLLTASFYLAAVPSKGNLVMINPLDNMLGLLPVEGGPERFETELEVSTGDLIIFPAYIRHYTKPSCVNNKRVVFVCDFVADNKIEVKE